MRYLNVARNNLQNSKVSITESNILLIGGSII